jgi:hypothetical protein
MNNIGNQQVFDILLKSALLKLEKS